MNMVSVSTTVNSDIKAVKALVKVVKTQKAQVPGSTEGQHSE